MDAVLVGDKLGSPIFFVEHLADFLLLLLLFLYMGIYEFMVYLLLCSF